MRQLRLLWFLAALPLVLIPPLLVRCVKPVVAVARDAGVQPSRHP